MVDSKFKIQDWKRRRNSVSLNAKMKVHPEMCMKTKERKKLVPAVRAIAASSTVLGGTRKPAERVPSFGPRRARRGNQRHRMRVEPRPGRHRERLAEEGMTIPFRMPGCRPWRSPRSSARTQSHGWLAMGYKTAPALRALDSPRYVILASIGGPCPMVPPITDAKLKIEERTWGAAILAPGFCPSKMQVHPGMFKKIKEGRNRHRVFGVTDR